jgi:putative addiction module component (TIGR02574 family)
MPVDMKALLALPQKERRKIAERLWKSLEENKAKTVMLTQKEKIEVEQRWNKYLAGNTSVYTTDEMRKEVFGK